MASIYRSEDMSFCDMYLHADDAFECVNRLGELGICQFKDMNSNMNAFQRHFVNQIRSLEEMERIIRYFERELKKEGMFISEESINDPVQAKSLNDMISHLENMEKELQHLSSNVQQLTKNHNELIELSNVLTKTKDFFEAIDPDVPMHGELDAPDEIVESGGRVALRYTAGVIPVSKLFGLTRLLYFATRGASYLKTADIETPIIDPSTGEEVRKSVFMVICSGQQLHAKVKKIAEGFHGTLYPCPNSSAERENMIGGVQQRLRDLEIILNKSREQEEQTLSNIAMHLTSWKVKVIRLKAVYHTLNLFRYESSSFVGQCWLPTAHLPKVQSLLNINSEGASNIINPIPCTNLPTYHLTNDFTFAFQKIIDAYAVASYQEINPAIFSIITFPFLFSVMFGDAGHGLIMMLFALYICLNQTKLKKTADNNEIFGIIFGGRYMILMMAIFSIYSGFIYNDFFSRSMAYHKSSWHVVYDNKFLEKYPEAMMDPSNPAVFNLPYSFGLDPMWKLASNQITFTNSFKKKISIVFGVCHMLSGVLLGLFNHIYFKRYINIICEFIPMLLFLNSLFGYLTVVIMAKWLAYTQGSSFYNCSPNLLIDFINMFLMKYSENTDPSQCPTTWFPHQKAIQMTLVVVAVISALWLLLSKPLVLYIRNKRITSSQGHLRLVEDTTVGSSQSLPRRPSSSVQQPPNKHRNNSINNSINNPNNNLNNSINTSSGEHDPTASLRRLSSSSEHPFEASSGGHAGHAGHGDEPFDFSEVMIHQCIHTIEFCLGCISHSASYLRLWALSLAHAQLSEVLWTMVMRIGLQIGTPFLGGLVLFMVFVPFAILTLLILLLMEGLSAFLHTLRLHWVEFNSKFYEGEGTAFEPFCFDLILKNGMKA